MSLEVSIRKKLASFDLEVDLTAGNETMGLLGASGCGKSLTLRCIAGVEHPDEGRIVVNGQTFYDSSAGISLSPQRRKTALLFQNYQLFPNMTVAANIAAGVDKSMNPVDRDEMIRDFIKLFGLDGLESRYPARLSGGQQQRVALARMLAARPGILMLDEPFSALDAHLKDALEQSLLELFDMYEGTILYVSHDIDEAFRFCNRIAVVEDGKIAEVGRTAKILHSPESLAAVKLSGCKNISRARKIGPHEVEALDWGMSFVTGPSLEVPDDVRHLGVRAMFIREADPGEEGRNLYALKVHRVSDSRFTRALLLDTPAADPRNRLFWRIDTVDRLPENLPKPGDVIRLHFDARHLFLVSR